MAFPISPTPPRGMMRINSFFFFVNLFPPKKYPEQQPLNIYYTVCKAFAQIKNTCFTLEIDFPAICLLLADGKQKLDILYK